MFELVYLLGYNIIRIENEYCNIWEYDPNIYGY